MKYQIERIPFPFDFVKAVSAINSDGFSYTIYLNSLLSDEQCENSVRLLVDEINKEATE